MSVNNNYNYSSTFCYSTDYNYTNLLQTNISTVNNIVTPNINNIKKISINQQVDNNTAISSNNMDDYIQIDN